MLAPLESWILGGEKDETREANGPGGKRQGSRE